MIDPEQTTFNEAWQARKDALFSALSDPDLQAMAPSGLKEEWLGRLKGQLDPAVERGQRWGNKLAMVIQFTDGQIPYHNTFIDAYFKRFGAHISTLDGKRLDVRSTSLAEVISLTPQVEFDYISGHLNEIPDGSFTVKDLSGRRGNLIVETDIEGVRLLLEGPALASQTLQGAIRPMLLVKIDDAPRLNLRLPEDEEAGRKFTQITFRELHGRETTGQPGRSGLTGYEKQKWPPLLIGGSQEEQELAHAGLAWNMKVKSADKIMVTPTRLTEDPNLKTEQERLDTLKQALAMAVDNLGLTSRDLGRPVVGVMTYGLVILAEVLKMTPEEITKDGEAMADLVEYLEEAACSRANPNALGHTNLIGPPPPNDPFTEVAKKIKETWEFPKNTPFHNFPFMYQRINWTNRSRQSRDN